MMIKTFDLMLFPNYFTVADGLCIRTLLMQNIKSSFCVYVHGGWMDGYTLLIPNWGITVLQLQGIRHTTNLTNIKTMTSTKTAKLYKHRE